MANIPPPVWTEEELLAASLQAIECFRGERMAEPLEAYLEVFDIYQGYFEDLLESTVDLSTLDDQALEVVTNAKLLEALRYLPGPPISLDDLKVVAEVKGMNPAALRGKPELAKRLVETIRLGLDRRRFPWVSEDREPTEGERQAAILASAALLATSRVGTDRRHLAKRAQESLVKGALTEDGFVEVPPRSVTSTKNAPLAGQYCGECLFGTRKADLLIGLWDGRVLPLECKVSNSFTNSVKRLNNDAAVKAEVWRSDFGSLQVVPSAVLGGVFKVKNLKEAQDRGLTLFWAHDLSPMLTWLRATKP